MQFIYLGEARFYEKRKNEFFTVSTNLEIKELSTAIEMNDHNTSDQVESNENKVADENMDIASHEDGGYAEPRAQSEPIMPINAASRRDCIWGCEVSMSKL